MMPADNAEYFAIVPAAGRGSRFGGDVPKQYAHLAGKPLVYYSLAALCQHECIREVWVVLSPEDEWWAGFDWSSLGARLKAVFCGGITRSNSVMNALTAMQGVLSDDDWVLVHDAARPCLSQDMISALMSELREDPVGGILAIPVADTLKLAGADQRVMATQPRGDVWQAQTPQMFRYGLLYSALSGQGEVTDEAAAIEAMGLFPRLVRADSTNFKVTYPADFHLAERILCGRSK